MKPKVIVFALFVLTVVLSLRSTPIAASTSLKQNLLPVDCIIDQVYDGINSITSIGSQSCIDYIYSTHQPSLDVCIDGAASDRCATLKDVALISTEATDSSSKSKEDKATDESYKDDESSQEQVINQDKKSCLWWIILLIVTNCLTYWLAKGAVSRQNNKRAKK